MEEKKETRREAAAVPAAQGAPAEPEHGGAVGRLLSGERPESLSGLKGVWLAMSCAGALCVLLSLLFRSDFAQAMLGICITLVGCLCMRRFP